MSPQPPQRTLTVAPTRPASSTVARSPAGGSRPAACLGWRHHSLGLQPECRATSPSRRPLLRRDACVAARLRPSRAGFSPTCARLRLPAATDRSAARGAARQDLTTLDARMSTHPGVSLLSHLMHALSVPPSGPTRRPLISTGVAAGVAACHRSTIVRAIGRGELPALRLGRNGDYRIRAEALEEWLRPTDPERAA